MCNVRPAVALSPTGGIQRVQDQGQVPGHAPSTVTVFWASESASIRIMTAATNINTRHPAVTAAFATTMHR